MVLNERSEKNLVGVHPDLVRVVRRAAELLAPGPIEFIVTEGVRSIERQKEMVAKGASKTMNSRHLTGHAVDIAAKYYGDVTWRHPFYEDLAVVFKGAAQVENVPIKWGGDWTTFRDLVHFELDKDVYK